MGYGDDLLITKLASKRSVSTPSKPTLTESPTATARAFSSVKPANTLGWCLSGKYLRPQQLADCSISFRQNV